MGELLHGLLEEIAARPLTFAAEALQALVLIALLAWAVRRLAAKRLDDRRRGIEAALAEADRAEREAASLIPEVQAVVARAEAEAPAIVQGAAQEAEREARASAAAVEAEAEALLRQARQTVELERSAIRRESSERLVRITAETARRYLDQVLTDAERRALMEKAIAESLEELERGSGRGQPGEPT